VPFDRQAVAALRARVLASGGPLVPLAAEAETLAEQARLAGEAAGEFELRLELLRLLAWQGEVAAAEPHLARLRALDPYHPGALAMAAEFAHLAGDRRRAAAFCGAGWALGREAMDFLGNGLLLGCWALAKDDAEHLEWCIETGNDLAVADKMSDLDVIGLRAHLIDAAIALEDWDTAFAQGRLVPKHFSEDAMPPLATFLEQRAYALVDAATEEIDQELADWLKELAQQAERAGWRIWLPGLDAALALAPEA
jgi:hypothetical protein